MLDFNFSKYEDFDEDIRYLFLMITGVILSPLIISYNICKIIFRFIKVFFMYNFTSKGKFVYAIINDDIKTFKRCLYNPNFDIYFQDLYCRHFVYQIDKSSNPINLLITLQREDMLKMVLSSDKFRLNEDEISNYFKHSVKMKEVNQLFFDKFKYCNGDINKLEEIIKEISINHYYFIENNLDYLLKSNKFSTMIICNILFSLLDLKILDIMYDKGILLPCEKLDLEYTQSVFIECLNINKTISLERFENFDDFIQLNKFVIFQSCDEETFAYLASKI